MNRRTFLGLLGASAAAMVLDPELALWKPGATTHILPPPNGWNLSGYNPLPIPVPLKFHKDAFSLAMDPFTWPDDVIRAAVKDLADKIDREALRIYTARFDVLYGMQMLRPELAVRIDE